MSKAGSTLLTVILVVTVLAALTAAVSKVYSSMVSTSLAGSWETRAYYLALSGLNFWSLGKTGAYALGDGSFTLAQAGPDAQGYYTVTCVGSCGAGVNRSLTARRKASKPITFDDDIEDFILPVLGKTADSKYAVLVFDKDMPDAQAGWSEADWATLWTTNANRYAGGWVRLGGGAKNTAGALWYGGDYGGCSSAPCEPGACSDGACTLGQGLRAFFRFVFLCYDLNP